jgi:hypothetical protein
VLLGADPRAAAAERARAGESVSRRHRGRLRAWSDRTDDATEERRSRGFCLRGRAFSLEGKRTVRKER